MKTPRDIYLDNAATTKPHPAVVEAVTQALTAEYGNPSSLHGRGVAAERLLRHAREAVAASLGASPDEIVFTSGGTEANSLAIHGTARVARRPGPSGAEPRPHIITTAVEHSSVLVPLRRLADQGSDVTVLPVDRAGRVSAQQVADALRPETALVSVMAVNNEVGTIQPIEDIGRVIRGHRARGSRVLLHVDAVQAWGKIRLRPAPWGVDLMTLSGHKVHGPKGVGALYVRAGVRIAPLLGGGEQERGIRPGTENVPGITGLGAAAEVLGSDLVETAGRVRGLMDRLRDQIAAIPDVQVNTPADGTVPHILNVTVRGVRGETLLHRLELDGIFVSTGSACHSHNPQPSHVLLAIGLPADAARSSVRLSLSRFTTREEIDATAQALRAAVVELRALRGRPEASTIP